MLQCGTRSGAIAPTLPAAIGRGYGHTAGQKRSELSVWLVPITGFGGVFVPKITVLFPCVSRS